jgi:class 3 adenylate cyclase
VAARLESFSSGSDVVISAAVRDDPEVAELLAAEPFEARLRGFDQEYFELWRVAPHPD